MGVLSKIFEINDMMMLGICLLFVLGFVILTHIIRVLKSDEDI